jgi:putative ABC transport system permease protein
MAGLLAMLLGLYVIFHTLSMSLVERLGEVGTLHALGVTRGELARIFLLEAAVLAGGGAILGQVGGIAIAKTLLAVGITTLGSGKWVASFEVPWSTTLGLAGVGFSIALLGSIYPLLLLQRSSTAAALRGEEALQRSGVRRGFHLFAAVLLVVVLPSLYLVLVPVVGEFSGELVTIVLGAVGLVAAIVALSFTMPALLSAFCGVLTLPLSRAWPLADRLAARSMRQSPAVAVSAAAIAASALRSSA